MVNLFFDASVLEAVHNRINSVRLLELCLLELCYVIKYKFVRHLTPNCKSLLFK